MIGPRKMRHQHVEQIGRERRTAPGHVDALKHGLKNLRGRDAGRRSRMHERRHGPLRERILNLFRNARSFELCAKRFRDGILTAVLQGRQIASEHMVGIAKRKKSSKLILRLGRTQGEHLGRALGNGRIMNPRTDALKLLEPFLRVGNPQRIVELLQAFVQHPANLKRMALAACGCHERIILARLGRHDGRIVHGRLFGACSSLKGLVERLDRLFHLGHRARLIADDAVIGGKKMFDRLGRTLKHRRLSGFRRSGALDGIRSGRFRECLCRIQKRAPRFAQRLLGHLHKHGRPRLFNVLGRLGRDRTIERANRLHGLYLFASGLPHPGIQILRRVRRRYRSRFGYVRLLLRHQRLDDIGLRQQNFGCLLLLCLVNKQIVRKN